VTHAGLRKGGGHPFYAALEKVLEAERFDKFVEELCEPFYAERGRPSIAPGIYFRCLLIGYFEGIGSERGIAWRTADSVSLRLLLGLPMSKNPPDHSTLSRTRRLLHLETHHRVFLWVLAVLTKSNLVQGKTVGVDATTLEANAAMRSIVRRDDGHADVRGPCETRPQTAEEGQEQEVGPPRGPRRRDHDALLLAHCWSHARRKFVEAEPNYPQCAEALTLIGELFAVDRDTESSGELEGDAKLQATEARLRARKEKAPDPGQAPRVGPRTTRTSEVGASQGHRLHAEVLAGAHRIRRRPVRTAGHQTRRSERYAASHWAQEPLRFTLEAWDRGGSVVLLFYSLLETAAMQGVDPAAYLTAATHYAVERNEALLPWDFARKSAAK